MHVCIEKGSTLHQVFNEGRLLGTFEGNRVMVLDSCRVINLDNIQAEMS
jgi:hypothetical protein